MNIHISLINYCLKYTKFKIDRFNTINLVASLIDNQCKQIITEIIKPQQEYEKDFNILLEKTLTITKNMFNVFNNKNNKFADTNLSKIIIEYFLENGIKTSNNDKELELLDEKYNEKYKQYLGSSTRPDYFNRLNLKVSEILMPKIMETYRDCAYVDSLKLNNKYIMISGIIVECALDILKIIKTDADQVYIYKHILCACYTLINLRDEVTCIFISNIFNVVHDFVSNSNMFANLESNKQRLLTEIFCGKQINLNDVLYNINDNMNEENLNTAIKLDKTNYNKIITYLTNDKYISPEKMAEYIKNNYENIIVPIQNDGYWSMYITYNKVKYYLTQNDDTNSIENIDKVNKIDDVNDVNNAKNICKIIYYDNIEQLFEQLKTITNIKPTGNPVEIISIDNPYVTCLKILKDPKNIKDDIFRYQCFLRLCKNEINLTNIFNKYVESIKNLSPKLTEEFNKYFESILSNKNFSKNIHDLDGHYNNAIKMFSEYKIDNKYEHPGWFIKRETTSAFGIPGISSISNISNIRNSQSYPNMTSIHSISTLNNYLNHTADLCNKARTTYHTSMRIEFMRTLDKARATLNELLREQTEIFYASDCIKYFPPTRIPYKYEKICLSTNGPPLLIPKYIFAHIKKSKIIQKAFIAQYCGLGDIKISWTLKTNGFDEFIKIIFSYIDKNNGLSHVIANIKINTGNKISGIYDTEERLFWLIYGGFIPKDTSVCTWAHNNMCDVPITYPQRAYIDGIIYDKTIKVDTHIFEKIEIIDDILIKFYRSTINEHTLKMRQNALLNNMTNMYDILCDILKLNNLNTDHCFNDNKIYSKNHISDNAHFDSDLLKPVDLNNIFEMIKTCVKFSTSYNVIELHGFDKLLEYHVILPIDTDIVNENISDLKLNLIINHLKILSVLGETQSGKIWVNNDKTFSAYDSYMSFISRSIYGQSRKNAIELLLEDLCDLPKINIDIELIKSALVGIRYLIELYSPNEDLDNICKHLEMRLNKA